MTQVLKELFPQCFDKNGDLMPHKLQEAILDLAQENNAQTNTATQDLENEAAFSLSKESYSLNWLGKSYAKLLRHLPTHTLIAQDSAHNAQPQNANSKNVLIKGDNLEVLKHLKNAYYRKVKMIYIDPPYNTGNGDFIYNDERSFTPQSLAQMANIEIEEASSILNLTLTNSSTHSAWLSFMYPRLYIARQLLRDDGVIFISIDDNEQANLKLLCDEIFGEDNFVVSIPRLTSAQRPAQEKYIGVNHDYILCYSKNKSYNFHSVINRDFSKEVFCDNIGKFFKNDTSPILASATQGYSNGGDYDIEFNGKIFSPIDSSGNRRRWLWTKERMQKAIELGIIVETKYSLRVRNYINKEFQVGTNKMVDKDEKLSITTFDLMKADFVNDKGTDEIKELSIPFSFPKPTNLTKTLLQLSTTPNSNDIILDFFAGSGTTAQAVMELNAEDKGNREFILVQLDEVIDKSKSTSKTAYEFCKNELGSENPTIFDITKERIKRASAKISNCHTERSEVSQNSNNRDSSLRASHSAQNDKVLDSLITTQPKNDKDLGFKIYELRENDFDSQNGALFKEVDKNALLESFRLQDSTPLSVENQTIDLGGYKAIRAGEKLYLLNSGFEMKHLQKLISLIDAQKDFVIKEISYLNDTFESARIREIEEGIKSYSNKKGLKILVRARFA